MKRIKAAFRSLHQYMFYKIIVVVGIQLGFYTISFAQDGPINKMQWLIGVWQNKSSKGTLYELWTIASPNEYTGKSYYRKGKDTVVLENIQLIQEKNKLHYIPTVKNQNNGLPVKFQMISITDSSIVFENQQHDFPQVISYRKISPDSLLAQISGMRNGQIQQQSFPMSRLK